MAEATMHAGGCHCGRVRFEAKTDLGTLISCNCSICSKKGLMLTFVPDGDFRLVSGYDFLVDYQFNKHVIHHLFCKVCGIQSFARGQRPDGAAMAAINIRCIDGIDANELNPQKFDGRSR